MNRRPSLTLAIALLTVTLALGDTGEARGQLPAGASPATLGLQVATFGGGCFWCMEPPFDKLAGVVSTTSGYIGGSVANPTYEQVSDGGTGHAEVVQVAYDPAKISYAKLLEVFWRNIDPLTPNRQFCDAGSQYRSAIFYHGDDQRRAAEASKSALDQSRRFRQPIVTQIASASTFYPAEEYHQNYYRKNPIRYKFYRSRCGRDKRLEEVWGKKS
ncbi:MAG: peptide-methionine (S)-S-oxide reductase MsrA [Gemmatimonadota bacterium]|nr:peptide-methionine (S)-S-oxide reductase MsrA [Gemmatimonadota bacterium]